MIGQTISHYKILEKLGAGGMGVVYKAQDLKLDRFVALKFLSPQLSADEEEKKRFIQEAKAASALDHVNICTIYEIDETEDGADGVRRMFIAMAYYEGETLKKRIAKGEERKVKGEEHDAAPIAPHSSPFIMTIGLPLAEAIDIAIQMAQGLAKAHAHGIVHRDIKPANVIITTEGVVKILDFGLAKLAGQSRLTKSGATLGTVAYMSPEQARGEEIDSRSDIWSFGTVLYEMLTGQLPFKGEHEQVILYSIIHEKPQPITGLRSDLPLELENIVLKCLAKKPAERYQHVDALLADLKRERKSTAPVKAIRRMPWSKSKRAGIRRIVWSMAVLIFAMMVFLFFYVFKPFSKTSFEPMASSPFTHYDGQEMHPAFSPDGKQLAFSWAGEAGENQDIYVKLLDAGEPLRLTNHPGQDIRPAWAPDGRHVAFVRYFEDKFTLYLIPALGGAERQLHTMNWDKYWSENNICWSPDGKFLAIPDRDSSQVPLSLYLLSLENFEKHKLTTPPALYIGDKYPAFSPDGKKLAFLRWKSWGVMSMHVVPLASGEPAQLLNEQTYQGLTWTADSREIVYGAYHEGAEGLWRLWRISATGGTPGLLPQIGAGMYFKNPTISRQGQLAYEQFSIDESIWRIEMPAVKGQSPVPQPFQNSTRPDWLMDVSPDGSRIVFASHRSGNGEIWMCDRNGHNAVQLTSSGAGTPRWSPDGQHITFDARPEGHSDIFILNVKQGNPQRITTEKSDDITASWSQDGRWIYFASNRSGNFEVWKSPAEGGEAVQITTHNADALAPVESFDGKWVYYKKGSQSGLWRAPIAGGKESLILEFPKTTWASWDLSKEGIYYINDSTKPGDAIEFFNFATGKATRIADLPGKNNTSLAVSPDLSWLLYSQRVIENDIMLVNNFR